MTRDSIDMPEGVRLVQFDELDSTNAQANRLAASGERGPLWILARQQSAGRGRSGRDWISSRGNLHASFLFNADCGPEIAAQLSLVAGVAVYDAIAETGVLGDDEKLQLKWPNDILVGDCKAGGILVETTGVSGNEGLMCVVGVGLNLVDAPDVPGSKVTALCHPGETLAVDDMIVALASSFQRWIAAWRMGKGWSDVRQAWLDRACEIGKAVEVKAGAENLEGRFGGLDEDGAMLLVCAGGDTRRVTFGDVLLVNHEQGAAHLRD